MERKLSRIKKHIEKTAELVEMRKERSEEWFDEACLEALRIINEHSLNMLQYSTRQSSCLYTESKWQVKKII